MAIFRQMGYFWPKAGDHFFVKIASEIWAIFGILEKWAILGEICEISWRNGRVLTRFGKNVTAERADFGHFQGWRFWRKISPNWRILIKQSWEH